MKIVILGAGAVGLSLAARLSARCDLLALCRPKHAAIINRSGFHMEGIWGSGIFHFSASATIPDKSSFDYCLITAKSLQTRQLCQEHAQLLAHCDCVSLQNGIGNEEIISEFSERVIGGTIITGFEWCGDAHVNVTVEAGPIRLGRFPAGIDNSVQRLIDLFRDAGLNVEGSNAIRGNLWAKTLYNCALNPLGAILDVAYGDLARTPTWSIIEHIVAEAYAVCRAEGVALPWRSHLEYLAYLKSVQLPATASHHSSMLQDIRNHKKTEIDFINGAVVRLAAQHGIATPVNRTLVDMIAFKSS
ncbi:MAG: ketopantoate reductase family protein [Gammaproteobacteria bacterium]|nr:ketopantoate reductase family protein [Gammaproteobacteria bacterium]MCB1850269.1 ketopantoate reductase family protein [Gammaproteobacteria bacterium]